MMHTYMVTGFSIRNVGFVQLSTIAWKNVLENTFLCTCRVDLFERNTLFIRGQIHILLAIDKNTTAIDHDYRYPDAYYNYLISGYLISVQCTVLMEARSILELLGLQVNQMFLPLSH